MRASALVARIHRTIVTQNLLPPPTRPLIAISGGQDSLTLAESLHLMNQKHSLWPSLTLAHCDHAWPGDEGIPPHVESYASSRSLPLHIIRANPPPAQTEAAGREWRYAELAALARREGFDAVVTGHTMTDLAETVLHAVCRGWAGGLHGMKWKRALGEGVVLVRPLLRVSREETGGFCEEVGLKVWRDLYNEDERFVRNRIRGRVVPVLKREVNGRVEEALCRVAHVVGEEGEFVGRVADDVYEKVVGVRGVDVERLRKEHVAVQRRVLKRVLGGGQDVGFEGVERVRAILGGGKVAVGGGIAVCEGGVLRIERFVKNDKGEGEEGVQLKALRSFQGR